MKRTNKRRLFICLTILALAVRAAGAGAKDLGDLLVERGVITKDDLEQLRREAQNQPAASQSSPTSGAVVHPGGTAITTTTTTSGAVAPQPVSTEDLNSLVRSEVEHQLPDWLKHFKLSTLIYMDWAYYFKTGFGPQFLTQETPPGPGNDGFNSFDLTRAYINLWWKPTDRFTIRVTPNVFREVDTSSTVNTSKSSQVATNVNGNLTYRLKYGYLQVNDVFQGMNIRMGQFENPLVSWEEDLYGYRFVNLVPLNYLAYSSADLGIAMLGPVNVDGVHWADYWLGVYNGSSFHSVEFNEKRSPQGRITVYPAATVDSLKNLGLTYFMSYGYTNVAPDTPDAVVKRIAALAHYTNKWGGIAFEFDQTRNENNFANFFTGAAPPQNIPDPADPSKTIPNPIAVLYSKILNPSAPGQGYNLFAHLNLGDSPFSLFGMWQRWYPNTNVTSDPLDFDRIVAGVAYQPESWLRVAVDSQNLVYLHKGPAVPNATTALFTNLEINY